MLFAARSPGRSLREHRPPRTVIGAVLFLHGGREHSHEPVRPYRLAVVRVRLLAWSVRRRLHREGLAVWVLQFSVRGWNGDEMSPVADARWALAEIDQRGSGSGSGSVPVVIVGHSMGGRTAVHAASAPNAIGVIGLAPWLPRGEPVAALRGRDLVIAHGTADRTTDPRLSEDFAARAGGVAASVGYERIDGDGHALLRRPGQWNRLVVGATLGMLGTFREGRYPASFSGGRESDAR